MAITLAFLPAAQRKRKSSAALLHRLKALRSPLIEEEEVAEQFPPLPPIDNNIIEFESLKAAEVLRPPLIEKQEVAEPPLPPIDNNIIEFEILPKLPAKSVCRFKCVSKHWKSLLSTPVFGKMHHHIHHMNKSYKLLLLDQPRVALCRKPLNHGSVTVGFNRLGKADPRFDSLVASLDGLVCVASTKTIINSLALWNPFTGAYYKLPSNPNFTRPFNFAEEFPHMGKDVIGFYSDSSSNDCYYKLLYLVYGDGAYIYSQRLNSWRKIEFLINGNYDPYPFLHHYKWSRATFCDHSLYFSVIRDMYDQCIVCFDVNTEEFRVIQFPPLPSGARCQFHAKLVVIDGCIHLCAAYELCYPPVGYIYQGSVWKLNGDGATWVQVAFFPGTVRDLMYLPAMKAICTTRNARDTWLAISDGGSDNSFDPFQVMNLEEFTLTEHLMPMHTYHRIIYDETLVSPYPPPPYGDMVGHI